MQNDLELTREETKIAKGGGIILMMFHHLFLFSDRLSEDIKWISIFSFKGQPIELYIASFGKICVGIFLFLSGYGIYKNYENGKSIKDCVFSRLKNCYICYWKVFLVLVPIGFLFYNKKFEFGEFLDNLTGWSASYNPEWWFFKVWIIIILFSPFFLSNKKSEDKILTDIIKLLFFSAFIRTAIPSILNLPVFKEFYSTILVLEICNILIWLPSFLMGIYFAKYRIIQRIRNKVKEINSLFLIILYVSIIILLFFLRQRLFASVYYDYIFSPIFVFCFVEIINKIHIEKLLKSVGVYSTQMWLIHSFFCYYYFQKIVFYPKISIFIVIWLIILSLSSAIIIEKIFKFFSKDLILKKEKTE